MAALDFTGGPHPELLRELEGEYQIGYAELRDIQDLCYSSDLPDDERIRLLRVIKDSEVSESAGFGFWMQMAVRKDCRETARQALLGEGNVKAITPARFELAVQEFCRHRTSSDCDRFSDPLKPLSWYNELKG